jgi:hypothetical protein
MFSPPHCHAGTSFGSFKSTAGGAGGGGAGGGVFRFGISLIG